jgi:hypothetical protein
MELLLISTETKYVCFSIAIFFLLLGVSVIMYAIRTAECYEFEYDPLDQEPVTYDEIVMREHFCADIINN